VPVSHIEDHTSNSCNVTSAFAQKPGQIIMVWPKKAFKCSYVISATNATNTGWASKIVFPALNITVN